MTVVSSGDGFLSARVAPTFQVSEVTAMLEEVRHAAEAVHAKNVLIDVRDYTRKLTVIQRLQIALAAVGKLRGFRVAGVFSEASFDPQRLGQTMANNRGANVGTFTDMAEAEAWLVSAQRAGDQADCARVV